MTEKTCSNWFAKFRTGDFNIDDKPRFGRPQQMQDDELQALLNKDAAQSSYELPNQLEVDQKTVLNRLHKMGMIQKDGKWAQPENEAD